MSMKRIIRDRRLLPEEVGTFRAVRKEIAKELPDLVSRHHDRSDAFRQLEELCKELKAARKERGLSLSELTDLTGMDRSALSKLESGRRPNPTLETLVRYADAVGKRLRLSLTEDPKPSQT